MKAKKIKKSVDIPKDLDRDIQKFIEGNDGTTFSLIAIQALRQWLEKPEIKIKVPDKKKEGDK